MRGEATVLAASYEAKARGVRTAMGGRQARELCPEVVVVPPRMEAYSAASKDVFAIFRDTTPLVGCLPFRWSVKGRWHRADPRPRPVGLRDAGDQGTREGVIRGAR